MTGARTRETRLQRLVKAVLAVVLRLVYRVEVRGLEHYRAAGERAKEG